MFFEKGEERHIKLRIKNAFYLNEQQWVKINMHLPDGAEAVSSSSVELPLFNLSAFYAEKDFVINTENYSQSRMDILFDCQIPGRHSRGCFAVTLMRK